MSLKSLVQESWFYLDESEKTKLNWFLYEYACLLFDHIKYTRQETLKKWKTKRNEEQIAEFCAYFSKRMRQSVLDRLAGLTEEILTDEEYICDYCHSNTSRDNNAILNVAEKAWEELLNNCIACPNRCISEWYMRSNLWNGTDTLYKRNK